MDKQNFNRVVKQTLEIDNIDYDADLCNYHIDSLDYIELIMALEEEYDIEIKDEYVDGLRTFGEVFRRVERIVNAAY